MNKINVFKVFMGLVFLGISFKFFRDYIDFKHSISNTPPISYHFINKRENIGGRGNSYDMTIEYQKKQHTLSITSKEYRLIEKGIFPKLFCSNTSKIVFSNWTIRMSLRISIMCLFFFIVAVFPWFRLIKYLGYN